MWKKWFTHLLFIVVLFFSFSQAQAQAEKVIETKSKLWNTSYSNRDSLTFYSLFDSTAIVVSAGRQWIGAEECKLLCRRLYKIRPDITWINEPVKIEVNGQWKVAYETGNWTEAWTEKGDNTKSEIIGKYWIMWRFRNNDWKILSAIFTPLSCKGSYCNK